MVLRFTQTVTLTSLVLKRLAQGQTVQARA